MASMSWRKSWWTALGLGSVALMASLLARAHTMGTTEATCPLDGNKFEAMVDMSGTRFGMRLDLKPLGPTPAPWRIPVCPKCHFVIFSDELSEKDKASLRDLVKSPAYTAKASSESDYYLVALCYAHLGKPEVQIGFAYLQASWEVEHKPEAYQEYLGRSLEHYEKALADPRLEAKDRTSALFLSGELRRLRGELDKARAVFIRIAKMPEFQKPPFAEMIPFELELIAAKDSAPKPMPEGPNKKKSRR
jgi:uncharacterized protein (DUF2225 family)